MMMRSLGRVLDRGSVYKWSDTSFILLEKPSHIRQRQTFTNLYSNRQLKSNIFLWNFSISFPSVHFIIE